MLRIVGWTLAGLIVVAAGIYGWTLLRPKEIVTEITIAAPAEVVWDVLTDFGSYPEWNPVMTIEGEAEVGSDISFSIGKYHVEPTIRVADPHSELRWLGRFLIPGIIDGEHYFVLEAIDSETTRLVHGETFTGFLVPFAGDALDVEDDFLTINRTLAARAEDLSR